jgi:hypothetical protein
MFQISNFSKMYKNLKAIYLLINLIIFTHIQIYLFIKLFFQTKTTVAVIKVPYEIIFNKITLHRIEK